MKLFNIPLPPEGAIICYAPGNDETPVRHFGRVINKRGDPLMRVHSVDAGRDLGETHWGEVDANYFLLEYKDFRQGKPGYYYLGNNRVSAMRAAEYLTHELGGDINNIDMDTFLVSMHRGMQYMEASLAILRGEPAPKKKPVELDIEQIKKQLSNKVKKRVDAGADLDISTWATAYSCGEQQIEIGRICHAMLFDAQGALPRKAIYDEVRGYYKDSEHQLAYAEYVDFLVNKSVFSTAFLTKNIDEIVNGGVFYNMEAPGLLVYAAAIMLRFPSEWDMFVPAMATFAEKVTDGDWIWAWVLANKFKHDVGNPDNFKLLTWDNSHKIFGEYYNASSVSSFLQTGMGAGEKAPASSWGGQGRFETSRNLLFTHGPLNPTGDVGAFVANTLNIKPVRWGEKYPPITLEDIQKLYSKFKKVGVK